MFVRDGAVTPGPSRKCDITFFVKGRPKSAQQSRDSPVGGAQGAGRHRTVIPGVTRMSFPRVKVPPFKNTRQRHGCAKARLRNSELYNPPCTCMEMEPSVRLAAFPCLI